jgi:hypothetical protein
MGPLRQIICRSLERRIHFLKSEINACSNIAKNAENVLMNNAYMNNQKRSTTNFTYNPNHQVSVDFIKTVNINDSQVYERLLNLLVTHYNILDFNVNPIFSPVLPL